MHMGVSQIRAGQPGPPGRRLMPVLMGRIVIVDCRLGAWLRSGAARAGQAPVSR